MANFKSNCGIPVDFEGFHNARMPQDVFVFFDDFLGYQGSGSADLGTWKTSLVGSPAQSATGAAILDGTSETMAEAGGILQETTQATAADGENFQVNGEAFGIEAGYPLYFETRARAVDISNAKMFIGLCITDTDIIAATTTDDISFRLATSVWSFITEKDSSEKSTDCLVAEADSKWFRFAFFYDGNDTIIASVCENDDGVFRQCASRKLSVAADYVPDDEMMTPSIEITTGATAAATVAQVDYVLCMQQRYPITRPV